MSTRVVITGGAGFLGALLARRLLGDAFAVGGAAPDEVGELVVVDIAAPPPDVAADRRVRPIVGDLVSALPDIGPADVVFHLAGVVSGAAEADFDLGLRTNVDGTRALLEHLRAQDVPPVLVFSSSLAVFGIDPAIGPVAVVDDDTLPRPQTSYGCQKFVAEQFVTDYTRKGFVRGRSVRLMTVAVRPGRPNAAASGFVSGIVREPLAGLPAICPVPADTPVALSSPSRTLAGLLRAAEVAESTWGSRTALNLPGIATTPADMAAAMDRVTGTDASRLIEWSRDPAIEAIVTTWPTRFHTPRAARLGLAADASFDDVVREYVRR